jgi:hypothetical protein
VVTRSGLAFGTTSGSPGAHLRLAGVSSLACMLRTRLAPLPAIR